MNSSRSDCGYLSPISMKVPGSNGTFKPMRSGGDGAGGVGGVGGVGEGEREEDRGDGGDAGKDEVV